MKQINQKAPVKCNKKITINSNAVDVWNVLTDINKWPEWQSDIKKTKIKGEPEEETEFEWTSKGLKIRSRIHTAQPYVAFGWTGKGFWIYAIHNWKITELNKQTEVEVEESLEGIPVWFFKGLLNKNLEKSTVKWLELLKKKCELFHPEN